MATHKRATELIKLLNLAPHPEGGYFREVFRSASVVILKNNTERSAITTIYFLLVQGNYSHWHRTDADEIWHFYEGAPLELVWLENGGYKHQILETACEANHPVAVVPAGCWQAARTKGEYTLAGCSVGPGFEFREFELLSTRPEEEQMIRDKYPELWNEISGWGT